MSAGPEIDLERWIRSFRGPLIGLLASFGTDWRTAEELAQDVFAEAWLGRERFRGDPDDPAVAGAWLRGIAFRLASARRRRVEREALQLPEEPSCVEPERDERRALLAAAFAELSVPVQTILRMRYLEETSTREVAALLGITPKAAEDRLVRARRELRARLERAARRSAQGVVP